MHWFIKNGGTHSRENDQQVECCINKMLGWIHRNGLIMLKKMRKDGKKKDDVKKGRGWGRGG